MKKGLTELVSIGSSIKSEDNPSENTSHDELKAAFANLKAAIGGAKEAADEFADVFGNIAEAAEANNGKIPDVNDIARKALADDLKGLEK